MEIDELLDRAKERANLSSDYALAKAIGIPTGNITNIRKGRAHPSNEVAVQLATLAGLDEMRVIAEIELRTAKNEKKKAFWTHYIESRGIAACLTMTALACSIALKPETSEASVLQLQNYGGIEGVKKEPISSNHVQKTTSIYIMRIINTNTNY